MMYDLDKESIIRLEMRKEQMTEMYDCWFAEAGIWIQSGVNTVL